MNSSDHCLTPERKIHAPRGANASSGYEENTTSTLLVNVAVSERQRHILVRAFSPMTIVVGQKFPRSPRSCTKTTHNTPNHANYIQQQPSKISHHA